MPSWFNNKAMQPIVRYVVLAVAFLILLAGGGGYGWLGTSLPETDGRRVVFGIDADVTVRRDADGVPTILAETWDDAWAGLGYVHAQDRLWQMESLRRFALGRLSEVIGPATVGLDGAQRRLDLGRLTESQFSLLAPETRAALSAYARGVNAFLAARDGALPLEFLLMRFAPGEWHPADGLLWGRLMAYQLSGRWMDDAGRARLVNDIGLEKAREIWPGIGAPPMPRTSALSPLPPPTHPAPMGASNAWAVTAGGKALLAGDPHLGLSLPGVWYLARLQVGSEVVEGATAPGSPFVIIGRTGHVAWSFTSNEADLQDVVTVNADDVTEIISDSIVVKDGDAQPLSRLYARGAPVVAGSLLTGEGTDGLALRATALQADDTTPDALMALNRAQGLDDAVHALRGFRAPLMNAILASADGRIAEVLAGAVPDRAGGDGRYPLPGPDAPWRLVPGYDVVPPVLDPPGGAVANANERLAALDTAPFPVAGDWPSRARADRLAALLSRSDVRTAAGMTAMQLDIVDIGFDAWKDTLAQLPDGRARGLLAAWDGAMRRDTAAPLIFASWMAHLKSLIFADELGDKLGAARAVDPARMRAMIDAGSPWCDDVKTPERTEGCAALPVRAFGAAVAALSRVHGDDPARWRWGDAHRARFRHALLGRLPFGDSLFDRDIATDGGDRTLNRGASRAEAGLDGVFDHVHGPGLRAVHDFAGPSRYIVAPGQSGNPLSAHYDDLLERWRDGAYVTFQAEAAATLVLVPETR